MMTTGRRRGRTHRIDSGEDWGRASPNATERCAMGSMGQLTGGRVGMIGERGVAEEVVAE